MAGRGSSKLEPGPLTEKGLKSNLHRRQLQKKGGFGREHERGKKPKGKKGTPPEGGDSLRLKQNNASTRPERLKGKKSVNPYLSMRAMAKAPRSETKNGQGKKKNNDRKKGSSTQGTGAPPVHKSDNRWEGDRKRNEPASEWTAVWEKKGKSGQNPSGAAKEGENVKGGGGKAECSALPAFGGRFSERQKKFG